MPGLSDLGNSAKGVMNAKQALSQLSHIHVLDRKLLCFVLFLILHQLMGVLLSPLWDSENGDAVDFHILFYVVCVHLSWAYM